MVLVGNKSDVKEQRVITDEQGKEMGRRLFPLCPPPPSSPLSSIFISHSYRLGCPYFETSAKLNINVEALFFDLAKQIAASPLSQQIQREKGNVFSHLFEKCEIL